jgi:hypothetical protein
MLLLSARIQSMFVLSALTLALRRTFKSLPNIQMANLLQNFTNGRLPLRVNTVSRVFFDVTDLI